MNPMVGLHGALLEGCRSGGSIELRTSSRVTGFDIGDHGVSVALDTGVCIDASALVGADGVFSRIRQQIVDDGEPLASGAVIYRAVIPAAEMPKDQQKPYPTLWAGPGTHIIYYPVRDWTVFNFGGTVVTGQTAINEDEEALPEEVLPLFSGNCDTPLRVMRVPGRFRRFLIRYREPAGNWSMGPVTLLGDAAHPMVQYIAQGAAMALEDAICLAVTADECDGDFAAAFERYQEIRIVRSARVQLSSLMMDKIYHASNVARQVRNSIFEGRTPADHYDRLAWLYTAPPYVRAA